jgi:hypothetical protein
MLRSALSLIIQIPHQLDAWRWSNPTSSRLELIELATAHWLSGHFFLWISSNYKLSVSALVVVPWTQFLATSPLSSFEQEYALSFQSVSNWSSWIGEICQMPFWHPKTPLN